MAFNVFNKINKQYSFATTTTLSNCHDYRQQIQKVQSPELSVNRRNLLASGHGWQTDGGVPRHYLLEPEHCRPEQFQKIFVRKKFVLFLALSPKQSTIT
jgi:hypothetical protein